MRATLYDPSPWSEYGEIMVLVPFDYNQLQTSHHDYFGQNIESSKGNYEYEVPYLYINDIDFELRLLALTKQHQMINLKQGTLFSFIYFTIIAQMI